MASLLLPIIYIAFISLGLPDSMLGAAWPSMYGGLGAAVSSAGVLSMIIAAGTVASSLASDWLNAKLGTGRITACSVLLTAVALFGFSISRSFGALCVFAVPYGIGAGSVDAALNHYVAVHYKARHMNWLHCMWGVGCSVGPLIMSRAVLQGSWHTGYRTIAILQIVLTGLLFASLPLWKDGKRDVQCDSQPRVSRPLREALRLPGAKLMLLCFFCYVGVEATVNMWATSYCTLYRGIAPERAAAWAGLFFCGITAGRFLSGFLSFRLGDKAMIRLGQGVIAAGVATMLLARPKEALCVALLLIGFGCAPIFPSIIHETPANFGTEYSQRMIGIQMAGSYTSSVIIPPLFGVLAQRISFALFPYYLLLFLCAMFLAAELAHRQIARH